MKRCGSRSSGSSASQQNGSSLWCARSINSDVLPYPAGAETKISFRSRNSNNASSSRLRVSSSARRLGSKIFVLLIGILDGFIVHVGLWLLF
ncbi:MAG: hypothetical protein M1282_02785 [Chloroflexi bacterium]|nr:hypothetical protein [Chloroflexota bacterium]